MRGDEYPLSPVRDTDVSGARSKTDQLFDSGMLSRLQINMLRMLMVFTTIVLLMTAPTHTVGTTLSAPLQASHTKGAAPALAGITPPPRTTLANMDIAVNSRSPGAPAIYELNSPLMVTLFRDNYASNAEKAGYRITTRGNVVVGLRRDGTSIRLRVIRSGRGSKALLTVTPPANNRT